jgi:hypothetical protein
VNVGKMLQNTNVRASSHDQETWNDLRQGLREQFPNPQRTGCPKPDVLKRLAQGTMKLEEAETWLDHFSRCSPCFCDFESLRSQAKRRRQFIWRGAAAAVILVGAIFGLWTMGSRHKEVQSVQTARTLQISLHFEDFTSQRDPEDEPHPSLQRLPAKAASLLIYLPAGSEAGNYEIAIFNTRAGGVPLATFAGKAEIEDGTAVLRTSADLSSLPPGDHILALRLLGGRWRYLPVAVS